MKIKASFLTVTALAIGAATSAPALAEFTIRATGGAEQVYIQTSNQRTSYNAESVDSVASISGIKIPGNSGGILVATFSAESECGSADGPIAHCKAQIFCSGTDMFPTDVAGDLSFNSSTFGVSSASITRHSEFLGPGIYSCSVAASAPYGSVHYLDDWTFTVKFWRVPG